MAITCCTHFTQQFSLCKCVFLRNVAKSALIPSCFILRSKGSNHLRLLFGGRKSLQTFFVANSPSIFVFLNLLPVCHWEMSLRCVVKPQENEKQGKPLRRGINSRKTLFLRARAVQSSLGCDEHCWRDKWSVLRIFQ